MYVSSAPRYTVTYYIKWVTTSWTESIVIIISVVIFMRIEQILLFLMWNLILIKIFSLWRLWRYETNFMPYFPMTFFKFWINVGSVLFSWAGSGEKISGSSLHWSQRIGLKFYPKLIYVSFVRKKSSNILIYILHSYNIIIS